jgi:hypothetical protein
MNICKLRTFVVLILACYAVGTLSGQTSINVKAGVETWSLKDEKMLSGLSSHPGQMIGFDVFVVKNRALFVPGFHYHRFSVAHEEDRFNFNFGEAHHFHYFTIPMTGGYSLISDSIFNLSLLAGGEIHFFYQLDDNSIGLDDDMLYGVSTARCAACLPHRR